MLNYDYVTVWENAYGKTNVRVLMAKNLKGEVMGGVVAINRKDYTQVGTYYVKEEYRYSGIGSKLFREVLKNKPGVFQAVHILLPTINKFDLKESYGRRFNHVKIENPSGFPDLQETMPNCRVVLSDSFSQEDWEAITVFDREVCGEARSIRELLQLEDSHTAAVFSEANAACLGFGISKELVGDTVRRLVIGPLYAVEAQVAEVITRAVLKAFYENVIYSEIENIDRTSRRVKGG
ncbi:hypothetical protein OESDEN_19985 [Oesophagostomum dentatum]|uniref:Uncharacterized protein n=1 Tax=Oesophagostomum dentatum TaxID=61180 RepID=A0A0B1S8V5_OESDE|nr:hypothetical protein OESDEN_19985 [Oesophagostomum dentatum]